MNKSLTTRLSNIIGIVIVAIIILLPFHEFLATWAASNFNHYDVFRVWKELLILLITPLAIYVIFKTPRLKKWIVNDWIPLLILVYVALNISMGLLAYAGDRVNPTALAEGLIIDLRFLVFFVIAAVAAYKAKFLKENWQTILLIPAVFTVIFGLSQLFLSINFLSHFGYGAKTIPAYSTVDQKLSYHRIQSTLRGPNPFGAYLILIISACFINLKKQKWLKLLLALTAIVALFFTYSRSAYIGLIISLVILYYLIKLHGKIRSQFVVIGIVGIVILGSAVIALRHNSTVDNVFFHTSNSSKSSVSSNNERASSLKNGLKDVIHEPLGEGVGTAGPASEHNNNPPRIAENYYIQVAQETGWLGLILFLAINIIVGLRLWRLKKDPLACLLFTSFIGISFVNLLSHEWADDTLSLIWWGMAGIMLTPAIIKDVKK
jgi:O-antigen ligase